MLYIGHGGLLLHYLWELRHLIREVNKKISHQHTNQVFICKYLSSH